VLAQQRRFIAQTENASIEISFVTGKMIVAMAQMSLVAQSENQPSKNARIDASFILNPVEIR
jgi:hypothetical protein